MPKNMNRDATFASAKARFLKKRIGSIGSSTRSSQRMKSANTIAPPRERREDLGRCPAQAVAADETPHDSGQTDTCQHHARQVELGGRPV